MLEQQAEKMIVGTALAVAVSAFLPVLKNTVKPLTETALQGGADMAGKLKYAFGVIRDEMEDIVAEAQFERMKKRLDNEIASESASKE